VQNEAGRVYLMCLQSSGWQGLELVAVASGSQEKGNAAAKAFGAKAGYANGKDLIDDPNVDIVMIAVKVPDHRELVLAAVAAGNMSIASGR